MVRVSPAIPSSPLTSALNVAQDGLAHLTVTDTAPQEPFTASPPSTGWAFRFTLPVHSTIALSGPANFRLGSWKVTIEDLAATPSVIDFQAVVVGANNEQFSNNVTSQPVMLLDAATYQNTRVHYQWARPATATTYQLRISGNGATYLITLRIAAP